MKCRKVKDIILTGFADGELTPSLKKRVEEHLEACEECRRLHETLKGEVLEPLRASGEVTPPEYLWRGIEERILEEEKETLSSRVISSLRQLTVIRKPALATIAVVFIVALALFLRVNLKAPSAADSFLGEQVYFLDYLEEGNGFTYPDLGIPVEDIFQ